MTIRLSPQTIEALADVISGGSNNDPTPPIGIYRQGWRIEAFMRGHGAEMAIGNGSRVSSLIAALAAAQERPDADAVMTRILEGAADPRDFAKDTERLDCVLKHLNTFLEFDGLKLEKRGLKVRLVAASDASSVVGAFASTAAALDFDTVERDLERALASIATDPEDAVTAACSVLESVCRSIIIELGMDLPDKKDIQGLYRAVREPLGLAPERTDLPSEIAGDVRAILGGLNSTVQGIGALRTHGGDAHGRERGFRRVDSRIARLAIHSASAAALFLIETWQQKYPGRVLHAH